MTSPTLRVRLRQELTARGCDPGGRTPHGTMTISDALLDDVLETLDIMIRRREKAFYAVDVVGQEVATQCYEDAVTVIEAIKTVLSPLCRDAD